MPEKTKDVLSLDAVSVDTAEVSSSDDYDRFVMGAIVGSISLLLMQVCIVVLYFFYTRSSGKGRILHSEYIPINGDESG